MEEDLHIHINIHKNFIHKYFHAHNNASIQEAQKTDLTVYFLISI